MKNKYPGQKNIPGLIHKIVNEIPFCTEFYELFAGSAAVSIFLYVLDLNVKFYINDISSGVTDKINFICRQNDLYLPDHTVNISNLNATDIIQTFFNVPATTEKFIFMDPPYLHSTRPKNTNIYEFELSESDHIKLLSSIGSIQVNTMIIHPDCDLYNEYLKSWRSVQLKIRYHNKTSIEKLYMNYEKPKKLLTTKYLGKDCWDRQRIKRKGDRLINKIKSLNDQERQFLIEKIKEIL
jgi:DNA adenine methylase